MKQPKIKAVNQSNLSEGEISLINFINSHPKKAKIVEISKNAKAPEIIMYSDYYKPLSNLEKQY